MELEQRSGRLCSRIFSLMKKQIAKIRMQQRVEAHTGRRQFVFIKLLLHQIFNKPR